MAMVMFTVFHDVEGIEADEDDNNTCVRNHHDCVCGNKDMLIQAHLYRALHRCAHMCTALHRCAHDDNDDDGTGFGARVRRCR